MEAGRKKPREPSDKVYYPGLQLEIRHKRATVIATVLEYISKTKIVCKINTSGEIKIISASNIRIHIEPPPGTSFQEPIITQEDAEKIKALLDTRPKSANPVGRPRIHPVGTDMSAVYRERYKFRRMQEQRERGSRGKDKLAEKYIIKTELRSIKIKGKPHQCTVKIYNDGTQAIAIKKSQLDPESRQIVNDLRERQAAGENVNFISRDLDFQSNNRNKYSKRKERKAIPESLPEIPRPDPSKFYTPPCNFSVYRSKEPIFIQEQYMLNPILEVDDCLKSFKRKFSQISSDKNEMENGDENTQNEESILFSVSQVIDKDMLQDFNLDTKWSNNVKLEFDDEDYDLFEIQEHKKEDGHSDALMQDLLPEAEIQSSSKSDGMTDEISSSETLREIRNQISKMPLSDLAEVLLPALVEKISPADLLVHHSKLSSDPTSIDLQKMLQHINKCKRSLSWIKNNGRSIENQTDPDDLRRAVITADEDNVNIETLLFDDENLIDVADAKLEMMLLVDGLKLLGTSTEDLGLFDQVVPEMAEDKEGEDDDKKEGDELKEKELPKDQITSNILYNDPDFQTFDLGSSTWNANHITSSILNDEEKELIKNKAETLVNLEEYEVKLDYTENDQEVKNQ